VSPVSRGIDRIGVTFDEPSLVADAGLIVPATLMVRLGLEALTNRVVHLGGRQAKTNFQQRSSRRTGEVGHAFLGCPDSHRVVSFVIDASCVQLHPEQ
jgi:hypothetical protein